MHIVGKSGLTLVNEAHRPHRLHSKHLQHGLHVALGWPPTAASAGTCQFWNGGFLFRYAWASVHIPNRTQGGPNHPFGTLIQMNPLVLSEGSCREEVMALVNNLGSVRAVSPSGWALFTMPSMWGKHTSIIFSKRTRKWHAVYKTWGSVCKKK